MLSDGEGLRNEAGGLGDLDGLGAALGAEFVEEAAGMGLHGVFTDEEAGGDFAIAEAVGDEAEDFQFAGGDAELGEAGLVGSEGIASLRRDFAEDGRRLFSGEGQAEPDAEGGEECGDEGAIDFDGMLDDEEVVLGDFQDEDEYTAAEAVENDVAQGAAARVLGGFAGGVHGGNDSRRRKGLGAASKYCATLTGTVNERKAGPSPRQNRGDSG
jgi:hypothetical protein